MKCSDCHKEDAVIQFTQIINGDKTSLNLCRNCAEKRGFKAPEMTAHSPEPIQKDFLGDFMSDLSNKTSFEEELKCPNCGILYSEFKLKGKLGCSECFKAFETPLSSLLSKIQGADYHTGKTPDGKLCGPSGEKTVAELKDALRIAIECEDYEHAARIRDTIRNMESTAGKQKGGSAGEN
ncbi:MAG: UvrB/UvrC motif-containing protein [Fibrobacterota bacterium]